jgi:type II secretory ATPase GspE/PulE/Tfp pilus assembly ATPase PilB-like protein
MVFPTGDRIEAQAQDQDTFLTPAKLERIAQKAKINTEQVFRLVDSILPFEACLYHQLLPLSLEGSRLKLGMVSPDDAGALDYVRRILAYMNCSLVPQTITTQVHHAVLTAYLSEVGRRGKTSVAPPAARPTSSAGTASTKPRPLSPGHDRQMSRQTFMPTLLVDSPADLLESERATVLERPPEAPPDSTLPSEEMTALPIAETPVIGEAPAIAETPVIGEAPAIAETPAIVETPAMDKTPSEQALPTLRVEAKHLSASVEVLAALPAPELLQELLGRLLLGGIGRLYFERQTHQGRILWSQDGVLQSVLEGLSSETMQGVVIELKRLTRMSLLPLKKPKQVEVERLYQDQRLLLRLRVMPGANGEEATLQVLRGAALKFYQQQQLSTIGRDALGIAQELQQKVNELRQRTQSQSALTADQLSILPALNEVLQRVNQQLEAMKSQQPGESQLEP